MKILKYLHRQNFAIELFSRKYEETSLQFIAIDWKMFIKLVLLKKQRNFYLYINLH